MLADMEIVYFNMASCVRSEYLARDVIEYLDLTCLLQGEMTYFYNDEKIVLHSGDAILFPKGTVRERLKTEIPVQYVSFNVNFPDNVTPMVTGHLKNCLSAAIPVILDMFITEWNSSTGYAEQQQKTLFTYLYTHLIDTEQNQQNPNVTAIKNYICRNLSRPLTLEELAEEVHLSPEYCCTLFKKHTGKTIISYINDQRIDTAVRLFRLGNRSVKQVALQAGFRDTVYFSKIFHRKLGMTPSDFLRQNQK